GQAWAPSRNMQFGWEPLWRDFSRRSRSLGGNRLVDVGAGERGFRITLRGPTQEEPRPEVDAMNRLRGMRRDILACRDHDAAASALGWLPVWGLLEEPARQRQGREGWIAEFEVWDRI